jgi:hypothetical protein
MSKNFVVMLGAAEEAELRYLALPVDGRRRVFLDRHNAPQADAYVHPNLPGI